MQRRALIFAPFTALALRAEASKTALRGKFSIPGQLSTPKGKIKLTGDEATEKVLGDPRLNGFDFEALGRFTKANEFAIGISFNGL